jgi:hypothetical protein
VQRYIEKTKRWKVGGRIYFLGFKTKNIAFILVVSTGAREEVGDVEVKFSGEALQMHQSGDNSFAPLVKAPRHKSVSLLKHHY